MEDVLKPYLVYWRDATARDRWQNREETEAFIKDRPALIKSLGWLLHDGEQYVVMAMSVSETSAGDLLKIPRSCIEDMWVMNSPDDESGADESVEAAG